MDFKTSQKLFSSARMGKFMKACDGNKLKTMQLYRYNLILCQRFYGILNIFEVILRNAVDKHYAAYFSDEDWIVNQAGLGKLLAEDREMVKSNEAGFRKYGVYSNDKMVASFTLGFWTFLFTKNNYRKGGKTLLKIFPNKAKGKNQADIYLDLTHIREFRNRIAHHEPICFDGLGNISTVFARKHYQLICDYLRYFGQTPEKVISLAEKPDAILKKIDSIK